MRGCNAEAWKYKSITYVPPAKNTDAYVIIGFDRNYSPNAKPEEKGKSPEGRSHIVFRWQYRIEMSAAPIPEMKTTGRPRPLACVRPN